MTLTLTTHICFSPGRVCHCFTVLPVEGFLPASLLDLSSGVSQHYWPLLSLFELCLLFFSSEKQTRIIQAFLPCQVLHFCLHARSRCCKMSTHPHTQGSCQKLAPPQCCCSRHPLHPKKKEEVITITFVQFLMLPYSSWLIW